MVRETGSLGWVAIWNRVVRLSLIEKIFEQKFGESDGICQVDTGEREV